MTVRASAYICACMYMRVVCVCALVCARVVRVRVHARVRVRVRPHARACSRACTCVRVRAWPWGERLLPFHRAPGGLAMRRCGSVSAHAEVAHVSPNPGSG